MHNSEHTDIILPNLIASVHSDQFRLQQIHTQRRIFIFIIINYSIHSLLTASYLIIRLIFKQISINQVFKLLHAFKIKQINNKKKPSLHP